jgi:beta-glucosidase
LPEKPLYGIGFGLSYTNFAYSGLGIATAEKAGESVTVEADVKHSRESDSVRTGKFEVTGQVTLPK